MSEAKDRKRVLIISHDKIGTKMAGPGIRYHYMAEQLANDFDVTVGFFDPTYLPDKKFVCNYRVKNIDVHNFEIDFNGFDVVIALWLSSAIINYCNKHAIFTVFDLYAPVPVENLAVRIFGDQKITGTMDYEYEESLKMYRRFFENGDLFLCSNQRQLDYWIGYIFGANQITPSTYLKRPVYDRFIYAPMGIDATMSLKKTADVMRGVIPGIQKTDKVILWTGGIWDWFDAQALIRAMAKLKKSHPTFKLVFFGTQHPNPSIPEMSESLQARTLAKRLGLTNKTVFFQDGWVEYQDRVNYLLEADLAIYTHKESIETEFSHRTRALDHILAELPTIATEGDYIADMIIEVEQLGATVPPEDPAALAQAITTTLQPNTYKLFKKNLSQIREDYDWSKTLKPLHDFLLQNPTKLPRLTVSREPLPQQGKFYRNAKRVVPLPVKKVIIKARGFIK